MSLDFLTQKEGESFGVFLTRLLAGLETLTAEERSILIFELRSNDRTPYEEALDRAKTLIEVQRGTHKPLRREKPQEEEKT